MTKALREAGWYPGRQAKKIPEELEFALHGPGQQFLLEFGGLVTGGLITHADDLNQEHRQNLAEVNSSGLVGLLPVGICWGVSSLWLDQENRFYELDSPELVYWGSSLEEVFNIVIFKLGGRPNDRPKWQTTALSKHGHFPPPKE